MTDPADTFAPPGNNGKGPAELMAKGTDIVHVEGLWKLYGRASRRSDAKIDLASAAAAHGCITAVEDASFSVAKGETFVVMGLSGSGKSTLLRLICRLVSITSGTVSVDGHDIGGLDERTLASVRRRYFGMVFQNFALLPHMTVRDNVAFPLKVHGTDHDDRHEMADFFIRMVGLDGMADRYPSELSGGQQQRVGIARALVTDPEILLMDEPFSALDPLIREGLQDEVRAMNQSLHKTILFVTHDVREAARIGDRIAIMKDGRILQIGRAADLLLRPVDDYVRRFVSGLPASDVVRASDIMLPTSPNDSVCAGGSDAAIGAQQTLSEFAERILQSDHPFAVRDDEGALIGTIDRPTALKYLISTSASGQSQQGTS